MAQLVARLVRNEKVGGSNPPSSTTGRHPIRMSVFCMPGRCCGGALLWRRWCSGRRRARPLYVPVGGGPPARSPHASLRLGVVDLEARPGPAATHRHRGQAIRRPPHRRQLVSRSQARHSRRPRAPRSGPATAHRYRGRAPPPPTGTPEPSGPSGALHTGGAWSLMCSSARRLEAWPGPATAAGPRHRPRAPQPGPEASIGTEAGLFHACLPSRPAKPAAYADRLLRYG